MDDITAAMVNLGPIQEGSILCLASRDDPRFEDLIAIVDDIKQLVGHDRFCLLVCDADTKVTLLGPDDLTEALRNLAKQSVVTPDASPEQ